MATLQRSGQITASACSQCDEVAHKPDPHENPNCWEDWSAGPRLAHIHKPISIEHCLLRLVVEKECQGSHTPGRFPELPNCVGHEHHHHSQHGITNHFPATPPGG